MSQNKTIHINGIKIKTNKNLTVLQACNLLKIEIPKFCFQENLSIAGNCRMCLVEIENSPKPVVSCAMPILNNMKIFTDSSLVQKARESVLEFLLINHPLDCPICDQASECDLQDQTMLFGLDKSRFFFNKRGIEDKYFGPFIKTIMTRCIHCTRCVRFVKEYCGVSDNLGTTGRGLKTEINFYNDDFLKSEFSGNLIDLCPVGALTSKPYSFKARQWELKKNDAIDILDAVGSNIKVDIFNNEIVRILPRNNFLINNEWISNKTRFFFDSLKYQRILKPMFKKENRFENINWYDSIKIINKQFLIDSSKIKIILGNLTDMESSFMLKKLVNKLGINNIFYENNKTYINNDFTSNFLFEKNLSSIDEIDLCLIINSDIIKEAAILNIHLINRLKKGNFSLNYIGNNINFDYPINNLGTNLNILIDIFLGKHPFCKLLKKAKNPLIIFGENFLNIKNGFKLINNFKNLKILDKKVNFLNTQTSFIGDMELGLLNNKLKKKNENNFIVYFNTNLSVYEKTENNFIVYLGHHFTVNAQNSDLILPSLTFLEKKGTYINIGGLIQKNFKFLNLKTEQIKDSTIYKYLYKFLIKSNKKEKKIYKYLFFKEIFPYILLNSLKISKFNFNKKRYLKLNLNFLNSLIKNYYFNTILEQYSKILINSKKVLKNNKNFNLKK